MEPQKASLPRYLRSLTPLGKIENFVGGLGAPDEHLVDWRMTPPSVRRGCLPLCFDRLRVSTGLGAIHRGRALHVAQHSPHRAQQSQQQHAGQWVVVAGNPVYGAANVIVPSPTDPSSFWSGDRSRGPLKTEDEGKTWTQTTANGPEAPGRRGAAPRATSPVVGQCPHGRSERRARRNRWLLA